MNDAIAQLALRWYASWLPMAWLVLAVSIFVLAPLSFWRRARSWTTTGMLTSSYVIGFTAWLLGAGVTFASFGWLGLIVGLLVFGVGVVPIGAVGAFFKLDDGGLAASIIGMALVAYALRFFALVMRERVVTGRVRDKKTATAPAPPNASALEAIDASELLEAHPAGERPASAIEQIANDGTGLAEPSARVKSGPPPS